MRNEIELDRILESYSEEMCSELQKLIRMRTVTAAPAPGAPFGEAIGTALSYIMKLGKEKSFSCTEYGGYAGEMSFGEGQESVGIVTHIDVVPEGKGWTHDPFGGELEGDRIYGRGTVDDKGPLIAAFYACLALKESGIPLEKKVKHVIGTDEETGRFDCIRYYKEHAEVPSCGVVPDSWFPAVYAEKGFVNYRFIKEITGEASGDIVLTHAKGGEAYNIVAPEAFAEFRTTAKGRKTLEEVFSSFAEQDGDAGSELLYIDGRLRVRFTGKAAHASVPEEGINAASVLLRFLERLSFHPADLCESIHKLAQLIACDSKGEGLGVFCQDHTGALTNNVGMLDLDGNSLEVKLNLRSPVTMSVEDLCARLFAAAESASMSFELVGYNPHYYTDPDDPNLLLLVNLYRKVTGDEDSKPKAHGGGSYARILEGFIPFGPSFQNEALLFHKQDEFITKERLLLLSRIYARALYSLAK
jgi:succinyl-diaminopimelate desuccinylase